MAPDRGRGHLGAEVGATGALVWSAARARSPVTSTGERVVFSALNRLPEAWGRPVAVVMQAGHYSAVPISAGVALVAGRRSTSLRLLVAGTGAWLACRAGKALVGRGRPEAVVHDVVVRGRVWTGAGFPSGHAAVASSLATVVAEDLGRVAGAGAVAVAAVVGAGRCYVGAHLPHDVVGGMALGVLVGRASSVVRPRRR